MKKIFKKGLLALTLIAGMAFTAPQTTSAWDGNNYNPGKYQGSTIHKNSDGSYVIWSTYEGGFWYFLYTADGTLKKAGWWGDGDTHSTRFLG